MRKNLDIRHHQDDYECMWNGIEDIYITKTGENIPNAFFFALSGFSNFIYLKFSKGELKRMPCFGDGRTKPMYDFLKDIVGFSYHFTEGRSFSYTLEKAKKEIDEGYPVVVGMLDMYELDYYPKLYHKTHIPIHYVLMTGYDDEKRAAIVLDCGKTGLQELRYDNLERGLAIEPTPLSKNNTICSIRMENPANKRSIVWNALRKKANLFLNPHISSLGFKGFRRFAEEFPLWQEELAEEDYRKCLMNMAMFMGTVPTMPNKLMGINEPDEVLHMAGRERMSQVMKNLGEEYDNLSMIHSAEKFYESGKLIEEFAEGLISYLAGENDLRSKASGILFHASELERIAFEFMLKSVM